MIEPSRLPLDRDQPTGLAATFATSHGKIVSPAYFAVSIVIQLSVNGQMRQLESGLDLVGLLESLELSGKRVAVERNGEIVPRSRYAQTALANGDRLEIVVAVGGG